MARFVSLESASGHLAKAQRVMVFGISGGGKSTLSGRISARLRLPHISLDRDMRWLPGWQVRDRGEQRALMEGFVARERWVIDGTSVSSFDLRLARADLAIWVRLSRLRALSYGRVRSDMAEGCPEQLPDWEFLSYIWTFERLQIPRIVQALEAFGPDVPVVVVRSHKEAARLLEGALMRS